MFKLFKKLFGLDTAARAKAKDDMPSEPVANVETVVPVVEETPAVATAKKTAKPKKPKVKKNTSKKA